MTLIEDIIVIDDLLDEKEMDLIEKSLLDQENNWVFCKYASGNNDNWTKRMSCDDNITENFQFVQSLIGNNARVPNSTALVCVEFLIDRLKKRIGIEEGYITRCKVNLNLQQKYTKRDGYRTPHYDTIRSIGDPPKEILIAIYYVHDSDGDTFIFEGEDKKDENGHFIVHKRVSPKKGRIVAFSNKWLHAAQPPFDSEHRIVINFNIGKAGIPDAYYDD